MIAALRLAVAFLTVIPVRPTDQIGRPQARLAMLLGPLAVLPVALVAAGIGHGATLLALPGTLGGILVVAVVALATRAMHLDGLADTVDGLGSGPDRDKALRILRSGDVGPMGAAALILAVLAQALGYGVLLGQRWGWIVVVVVVAGSRVALATGCATGVPAARPDGLGALFAGSVPPLAATGAWLVLAVAAGAAGWAAGRPWWWGAVAAGGAAAAALAVVWVLRRAVARFGGITGDVLGALVEAAASMLAVLLAASPPVLGPLVLS